MYYYSPFRSGAFRQFFYDENYNFLWRNGESWNTVSGVKNAVYMRFRVSGTYTEEQDSKISINVPSTDHTFVEHHGETIPVLWQTEAGTVYACTIDLLSGLLTVNWALVTFDGTESWSSYSSGAKIYFRHSLGAYGTVVVSGRGYCSLYPWYDITGSNTGVGFRVISSSGFNADLVNIRPDNVNGMTATVFKEMLADWYANGTPCTVAYKMKNPVTYQLDSHQISTLMGSNRIWTDVGTISLDYRAMRSAQNTPLLGGMLGNPNVEEPIEEVEE